MVHADEVVKPASVTRQENYGEGGAYHEHFHITTPKEVVSYDDLSRESSFKRRQRGRGPS
jgi:hypothetical protein